MKSVIYETKGRAREFNELAINLFTGCEHQCIYCYGADVTHQDKESFQHKVAPRITVEDIQTSARAWRDKGERRRILLCFVTDPYTPCEQESQFTRQTIKTLHTYGFNVSILTKGGLRSTRDFDLMTSKDAYATTLTCFADEDSLYWEPKASLPCERIKALEEADLRGIETWVSLEPVIYPQDAMRFVKMLNGSVGHWKVGTMNYHPHGKTINWREFGWKIKGLMDSIGAKYYFKKDLLKEMAFIPADFKQTWVCR
jgi:DNA repair photolyase